MAISFQIRDVAFSLSEKSKLRKWIQTIIISEGKKTGDINYLFTNDEAVLKENIAWLNHNTYTDIITFDYCENDRVSGDIIISIDRVTDNAKKFKVDFQQELRRVMVHGVLHLCGYKDKRRAEAEMMRKKENQSLKAYTTLFH